MFYYDWTYILFILPAVLFTFIAKLAVNGAYEKYSKKFSARGMTGAQAARAVLEANHAGDVAIKQVAGKLTDNFNPETDSINLSEGVYSSTSIAAIGIAAHEAGHAVQYSEKYFPMEFRGKLIPVSKIGSTISFPLIAIGILLSFLSEKLTIIAYIGVGFFALSTLFELVTLPVEINASRRAVATLSETAILSEEEMDGAKKVLRAAALTYVASLAVSLAYVLRFLFIIARISGDRR
ncbi:MAG: zinc metallopeptidase [Dehalococcoidales bacterium]|nr:zinc metallopeptidase [Dehalococcoidales bacterium]